MTNDDTRKVRSKPITGGKKGQIDLYFFPCETLVSDVAQGEMLGALLSRAFEFEMKV